MGAGGNDEVMLGMPTCHGADAWSLVYPGEVVGSGQRRMLAASPRSGVSLFPASLMHGVMCWQGACRRRGQATGVAMPRLMGMGAGLRRKV